MADTTSIAIAASTKYMLEHIETTVGVSSAFARAPKEACRLLAAGVYYMGKILAPEGTTDEQILQHLENANVEVKVNSDGRTYNINNLNFYLTAQTVHQLNTNPKEVINTFQDQVQQAALKLAPETCNLKLETTK